LKIKEVTELFKSAGIEGRLFASMEDALKCDYIKDRRSLLCPGRGRRIHFESCKWHRETKDPLCSNCCLTFGVSGPSLPDGTVVG
jgi:hypothetical protein